MSAVQPVTAMAIPPELARVAGRRVLVFSPTIHFRLGPGDRALVVPGDAVVPGMPIAERTPDAELVDVGRLERTERVRPVDPPAWEKPASDESVAALRQEDRVGSTESQLAVPAGMDVKTGYVPVVMQQDRRRQPFPGKWWVGGGERRGKPARDKQTLRLGGTLLFETHGRWRAAAGERHTIVESPIAGVVREARNCVDVTIAVTGAALTGAIAAGEPSRGYLDVPRLTDGELWANALDVGRTGAVVVAGSRISAQAISRARAMSIRGLIAGSCRSGSGDRHRPSAARLRRCGGAAAGIPGRLGSRSKRPARRSGGPLARIGGALSLPRRHPPGRCRGPVCRRNGHDRNPGLRPGALHLLAGPPAIDRAVCMRAAA